MAISSSLRNLVAPAVLGAAVLALAGCNNATPPGTTVSAPAAPTPTPGPKSATPNTFDEVTSQLDPGGDFYLYLNTAQFLSKLSQGIDTLHDVLLSGSGDSPIQDREQAEKGFTLLKDVIQKSGIEDATGLGLSSFAATADLHRNKFFIHHYQDKGTGLIWSLFGKAPHPLSQLDFLPADTAMANFGDFDLAQFVNFIRQEASQSGIPEAQQAEKEYETQFAGVTQLKLDDVLGSLNGQMGMLITLDSSNNFTVPGTAPEQTIPYPRLAIFLAVKNDLIFKRVDEMATGNPAVIKTDETDLKMRVMPVSIIPGLNLRVTVAQWNGYLVIATDDKLIRDMIAVQKGGTGLKTTPEYTALSAGMPQQGNSFGYWTQRFTGVVQQLQKASMENQAHAAGAQAAGANMARRLFEKYQRNAHGYGVGQQLPNGWYYESHVAQSLGETAEPVASNGK